MADKKANESVMGCVAALLAVPLHWLRWVVEAWCFSIIWGWFVVPLGAPVVGVLPAFGLMALIGMATHGKIADSASFLDAQKKVAESTGMSDGVASLLLTVIRLAEAPLLLAICWASRSLFG